MSRKMILSSMTRSAEVTRSLQADIQRFGSANGMEITCQEFDYVTGWSDFMRMSIYGGSPDVSEIGTTWIHDFAAMNVLRPFSASELRSFGGAHTFVPGHWQSGIDSGALYAIPWMTDLSMVFYRRDLFAKAGIPEKEAFTTPQRFEETLQCLQQAGVTSPLVVPTQRSYINVHNLAMWVWQAGLSLVDTENKTVLFDDPAVRAAILSFFKLHRYISKDMQNLAENEADQMFIDGKAAVTISGPWNITFSLQNSEVAANLGLAIPLGHSYLGGASLMVWERTSQPDAALALIEHLTGREFQTAFPRQFGLLPGRLDCLDSFPLPDGSLYPLLLQGLQTGRSLPNIGLWGLIEDRLAHAIPPLWQELFASDTPDLEALYDEHIAPLARRLNITLSQA